MSTRLAEFIRRASDAGGLQTDDVLAAFLPLARRVADWHEQGLVAPPLRAAALWADDNNALGLRDGAGIAGADRRDVIAALQRPPVSGLQVVGRGRPRTPCRRTRSTSSATVSGSKCSATMTH